MRAMLTAVMLCACLAIGAIAVQPASKGMINEICPMSGQPVRESITLMHEGETIGFCCPGCRGTFSRWDDDRKSLYIASQRGAHAGGEKGGEGKVGAEPRLVSRDWKSDLYTLDECPITGQKLGSMGEPSVHVVDEREVRFCCPPCLPRFERMGNRWQKVDERMVKDQRPRYPLEKCVVSGLPLGDDAVDRIYRNRLVRFCRADCEERFLTSPEAFLSTLDQAVIAKQRPAYPLEVCIISGRSLADGVGAEVIAAGRLMRLCGEECAAQVKADPLPALAKIDAAWAAKQGKR